MKKLLIIKTLIIVLLCSSIINRANAQYDADPAVASLSFANSPIAINTVTTLTASIINEGYSDSLHAGSFGVKITLPSGGEYAAYPQSKAAISGNAASKFDWTYDSPTKTFIGTSNQNIFPNEDGDVIISIMGYNVSNSATSTAEILTLDPGSYPFEDGGNNNLTSSLGVTPGPVLPTKLLSFNVVKQNNLTKLNWQTSQETNSSYFDIQTSKNGTSWETIGMVQAVGNSNSLTGYSFTHNTPAKGINYYRLKQVDLNDKIEYSFIRSVNFSTKTTITVMPNPTVDKVYISTASDAKIQSVLVYSSTGKLMKKLTNFEASNSVDMSSFTPGVYMLRITDKENNNEIVSVVKH